MTIEEIEEKEEAVDEPVAAEEDAGEEDVEDAGEEDADAGEEEEEDAGEEDADAGEEDAGEEDAGEEEENLEQNEKKINDKINEWIENAQKSEDELKLLTHQNEKFLEKANQPDIMKNIAAIQNSKRTGRGLLSSLNSQNSRTKTTKLRHFKMKLF